MAVDLGAVLAEMSAAVGFVEGPNDENPWGPEQGVHNAAYCASFAHVIPYHHGYRFPPESQFGEMGTAYVPYIESQAQAYSEWGGGHQGTWVARDSPRKTATATERAFVC